MQKIYTQKNHKKSKRNAHQKSSLLNTKKCKKMHPKNTKKCKKYTEIAKITPNLPNMMYRG
jgi:tRNA A37 N6-isopentenylltransferase MiaA